MTKTEKLLRKCFDNAIFFMIVLFIFAFTLINTIMLCVNETRYHFFSYSEETYVALEDKAKGIINSSNIETDSSKLSFELSSEDGLSIVRAKVENLGEPNEEINISRNSPAKFLRIFSSEVLFILLAAGATIVFSISFIGILLAFYYISYAIMYTISKVKSYFT